MDFKGHTPLTCGLESWERGVGSATENSPLVGLHLALSPGALRRGWDQQRSRLSCPAVGSLPSNPPAFARVAPQVTQLARTLTAVGDSAMGFDDDLFRLTVYELKDVGELDSGRYRTSTESGTSSSAVKERFMVGKEE